MAQSFKAARISDHVYWVGAIDWGIRDFHGYSTSRGSTYNSFVVLADKIALIDTVKAAFKDEMLARIASVVEPGRIEYIVSNHSEMDHSGCLADMINVLKPEKVVASVMGAKALADHFHLEHPIIPVKDGETLNLGNMDLGFIESRMIHWPDSMMSYLGHEKVLFSQDGFGMHLASSERFADQIDPPILESETARYYANILMPFSDRVSKLLEKIRDLGIKIDVLAPDHGPIWRKDIGRILDLYARWADRKPGKKAVIVYDTMWHSTALMARTIHEGMAAAGVGVQVMPLQSSHRSDVATEILEAGALLVGSPTINNNMFPTVADTLTYLKGLRPRNLIGTAFGSFGWSGEAVGQVMAELGAMKVRPVGSPLKVKYVPEQGSLEQCRLLGAQVAEELRRVCDD